jgi:hypothetical protein
MATDQITIEIPEAITPLALDSAEDPPPFIHEEDGTPARFTFYRTLRAALPNAMKSDPAAIVELLHEVRRLEREDSGEPLVVSKAHHEVLCEAMQRLPFVPMVAGQLAPHRKAVEAAG